jgi:hypothetical protein
LVFLWIGSFGFPGLDLSVFRGSDLSVFKDFRIGGSSGSLDVRFLDIEGFFSVGLDCSRLLIQRCKTLLKK